MVLSLWRTCKVSLTQGWIKSNVFQMFRVEVVIRSKNGRAIRAEELDSARNWNDVSRPENENYVISVGFLVEGIVFFGERCKKCK